MFNKKNGDIKGMPKWFREWEDNHFHSLQVDLAVMKILVAIILAGILGLYIVKVLG